jgi:hypothetical protein
MRLGPELATPNVSKMQCQDHHATNPFKKTEAGRPAETVRSSEHPS